MNNINTNESNGPDRFIDIIEDPRFYGSKADMHSGVEYYESLSGNLDSDSAEQIDIRLGLLSIRIRNIDMDCNRNQFEFQICDLAEQIKNDLSRTIKLNLVKAQFILSAAENCLEAKNILTELASKLGRSDNMVLYGVVSHYLAYACVMLDESDTAEEYLHDAISIFRRFDMPLMRANCLNNYGVLKKKLCDYFEAEKLFRKASGLFEKFNASAGMVFCYWNLGILKMKAGDWLSSGVYLDKAASLLKPDNPMAANLMGIELARGSLYLKSRNFIEAEKVFKNVLSEYGETLALRRRALAHEFLGELYTETCKLQKAEVHLEKAHELALQIAPDSDLMTEIFRREAELYLQKNLLVQAEEAAQACIKMCMKIKDRHEMGAALRVLGKIHARAGRVRKAKSAFAASVSILKSINESVELMKSRIAFGYHLVKCRSADADVYLLEAKDSANKLGLDYYTARSLLALARHAVNTEDFAGTRACLNKAEQICEGLEDLCKAFLAKDIKMLGRELERSLIRYSNDSAGRLKILGEIYQEARFPLAELTPEVAMKVARNVGAESIFLVNKKNSGYRIPIVFNIPRRDARSIAERIDKSNGRNLFKISSPRFFHAPGHGRLVGVPGGEKNGWVLCAVLQEGKGLSSRELEFLIASAGVLERLAEEKNSSHRFLPELMTGGYRGRTPNEHFDSIATRDQEMLKLIKMAERAGKSGVPVLLQGETGVGKELFARAIHNVSSRSNAEFIAINTGGLPLNFLESELFGYARGAFTGARTDRRGLIETASGGTLFLDEVGEMSEELQVKLLRLLENGEYRRLGENKLRCADVRVISATNRDLKARVKKEKFREDLYYRLSAVRFTIPALRSRRGDIEMLVRHFLQHSIDTIKNNSSVIDMDVKAMEALELYDWPGNIRELQNEMMRLVSLLGDSSTIRFNMLSDSIKNYFRSGSEAGALEESVERFERRLILEALEESDWNRRKAAEKMGIPRTTLLSKMRRLSIIR